MKVLLVEPPKKTWDVMGDCTAPPLGLAQLAAVLREESIPVEIVDCNAEGIRWSALPQAIAESTPDIIGATALTPTFFEAARVMKIAKKVNQDIATVLGGPHVTFTPEETLLENPEVDIIVRGEGERTLVELVHCLEDSKELSQVKGIAYRRGKEIINTPDQALVDVNALPLPAYDLLPMKAYRFAILGKYATILSSRGCPFQCTFCSEWRFWGGGWRPRDPKSVVDEIELLKKEYDRESIWFGDDCFNISSEHAKGICDEIMRRGLDISWFYQGRADSVIKQKDLLPLMRKSGNLMVQIGIESSTDKELKRFKKGLTTDHVKEAIRLLRRNDIVSQGLIILGTREDTADSIIHKQRYMKWLDPDFPIFTAFTPFPGSDTYQEAKAHGWIKTRNYSLYDMSHAIMATEQLSRDQLSSLLFWCFSSYYTDLIKISRGLFSGNSWKRGVWRHMLKYTVKQILRTLKLW